jgi:tetratricopeptide (TPR) repeat protein
VYSAFDVSFDYLQKTETVRSRDAIELLRVSAFYHFEKIPEAIFTRAVTNRRKISGESPDNAILSWLQYFKALEPLKRLPQLLMETGDSLSESRVTWALDELQSLSLISRNAKQGTFSMHPLVHQWARDKLTGTEKAIWASISMNTLLESVVLQLDSGSQKDKSDARTDGLFHQNILPHLNVCLQEHGSPVSSSTATASRLSILFSSLLQPYRHQIIRAELLNAGKCAVIFGERGQFQKAAVYLGEVKDVLINIQGLYSERTMVVMHYLSNLYWGLGRLEESIDLLNRVVEARKYASGPDHEQTLIAMSSLGRAHWLHGDYVQSLSVLESTTERMQAILGESHAQTLAALDNYGVTLGSWHRFEESRKIHERVLEFREKSLGPDDPETLSTKMNLAMALLDLGQLEEAERLMRIVYQRRQQQLGKEHPWTLWALCYLTKAYIEKGSLHEAETLLTWGIEAGTRSLSKDHLGVLMGQGYLAIAYARQGKLEKAENLTLETLSGLRKSRGMEHPDCVFCQWKLAELYQLQSRPRDAIRQCEEALEIVDLRLTRNHPLAKKIIKRLEELRSTQSSSAAEMRQHPDPVTKENTEVRRRIRHQVTW